LFPAGSIPVEIGNLTGLASLWLYENQLSGAWALASPSAPRAVPPPMTHNHNSRRPVPSGAPLDSDGDMSYPDAAQCEKFLTVLRRRRR